MMTSTALLTDQYELTMLSAALADGTAHRPATFALFARRLPDGRDRAHVAGIGRALQLLERFRFDRDDLDWLTAQGALTEQAADWLDGWQFTGDIDAYAEGELYGPNSPVLTVRGTFADVLLETLLLSTINHDTAVATTAAGITAAAAGRPVVEMGSRRTHEQAAVAAARACYIGGFTATSNLAAGRQHGVPTMGTAAHAWTLAHAGADSEQAAFESQLDTLGPDTALLVDTYDTVRGIDRAIAAARTRGLDGPGAVRIDSGDLAVQARRARTQLDAAGAAGTRIVVSGDLDEPRIAELVAGGAPIDTFGVGTRAVAGLTPPGFVFKLVEIHDANGQMVPVGKTSTSKTTPKGRKVPVRPAGRTWDVAAERHLDPANVDHRGWHPMQIPAVRGGQHVYDWTIEDARALAGTRRDLYATMRKAA